LAIQTANWIENRSVANITLLQTLQNNLDIGEALAITLAFMAKQTAKVRRHKGRGF
jgi:predicted nucleic acid-binding protein